MALADDLNGTFAPWVELLTSDEIEALRYYQGPDHEWINRVLRSPNAVLLEDQSLVVRRVTELLDSAIQKGAVPFRLTAYRGLRDYSALFGDAEPSELAGAAIYDPAFVSTSVAAHRAERFMHRDEGFRLQFDVPIGHSAAWLPLISDPDLEGQRELLLPRELEIEVVATWEQEGILYVEGRLL